MAALRSAPFLVDYITDTAAFEFSTGTGHRERHGGRVDRSRLYRAWQLAIRHKIRKQL